MRQLMHQRGLTAVQLAQELGCTDRTIRNLLNKIPRERKRVLAMAMALGLDLDETNELLKKYAKFHGLYPKDIADAAAIYLIQNHSKRWDPKTGRLSGSNPYVSYQEPDESEAMSYDRLVEHCSQILHRYRQEQQVGSQSGGTGILQQKLLQVQDLAAFDAFIQDRLPFFCNQQEKLVAYLDQWLHGENLWAQLEGEWDRDVLVHYVAGLRNGSELPQRDKLIDLGIKLRMPRACLDEMLEQGGLEPLWAKDKLEGALIVVLQQLYAVYPSLFGLDAASEKLIRQRDPQWDALLEQEEEPALPQLPDEMDWGNEDDLFCTDIFGLLDDLEQQAELPQAEYEAKLKEQYAYLRDIGLMAYIRKRLQNVGPSPEEAKRAYLKTNKRAYRKTQQADLK